MLLPFESLSDRTLSPSLSIGLPKTDFTVPALVKYEDSVYICGCCYVFDDTN